jgi:TIR domain
LGGKGVFVDVASVNPGANFHDAIAMAIGGSKALIAVIGADWISAKDGSGRRKLDDPSDYVRLELEHAFRRDIKVIPALVCGAKMPRADQLPDSLRKLSQIQALELRDTRWDDDFKALLKAVAGASWTRLLRRHEMEGAVITPVPDHFPSRLSSDTRTGR